MSGSIVVSWNDFDIEIIPSGAAERLQQLNSIRDDVIKLAALSRGWSDPEHLEFFGQKFKIEQLYETNALTLACHQGQLVGIAGTANNWHRERRSIVHLCSFELLPSVQGRGLLQCFASLLLLLSLTDSIAAQRLDEGVLYATAITQSPYVYGLMARIATSVISSVDGELNINFGEITSA